ncbi:uncharacterized protein LOC122227880 isoform X14 [Panthera leo]|uniref:uncharacterized protein LOC122227880 isoform X14 n=1 Tax=Panthera leo TaxID=9689 RepID=UPI001C69EE3F|nr:uncharacterized protein LOC122227880 isoform X14 [Panthera leo]XP_042808581.1 uncharacterized protein LOC122227880 isoform X14 [Panthera leo]
MIFLRNWGRAKKNPVERRILTLLSCPSQCSLFVTSNNAPRMAENTLSNPAPIQEQSRSPPRITSTEQDVLSAITQKFTRLLGTLCHQWREQNSPTRSRLPSLEAGSLKRKPPKKGAKSPCFRDCSTGFDR